MSATKKSHPYFEYDSVKIWIAGAKYPVDATNTQESTLELLEKFCVAQGKNPDELVQSCLRTTSAGDLTISAKARREIDASIDNFVAENGYSGHQAIMLGNQIREFLIHNGVFMQGKVSFRN